MLQLVRKDFMIHKTMLLAMLVGLIIYMILDVPIIVLGIIFPLAMTMQIFAIDEKHTAQMLLSSLPLTRKEIVSSKYIAAFLYIAMIIVTLIAGSFIFYKEQPNWVHLGFIAVVSLLIVAFMYPFSYKFASKYILVTFIIGFAIFYLASKLFIPDLDLKQYLGQIVSKATSLMEVWVMIITLTTVLVIYSISWLLSVKIYEKKVF